MSKSLLVINCDIREVRVALIENGIIAEFHIERANQEKCLGDVVLGKVSRVLPGMQAAFIDVGLDKAAFLHVEDLIRPDDFEGYLTGRRKSERNADEEPPGEEDIPAVTAVETRPAEGREPRGDGPREPRSREPRGPRVQTPAEPRAQAGQEPRAAETRGEPRGDRPRSERPDRGRRPRLDGGKAAVPGVPTPAPSDSQAERASEGSLPPVTIPETLDSVRSLDERSPAPRRAPAAETESGVVDAPPASSETGSEIVVAAPPPPPSSDVVLFPPPPAPTMTDVPVVVPEALSSSQQTATQSAAETTRNTDDGGATSEDGDDDGDDESGEIKLDADGKPTDPARRAGRRSRRRRRGRKDEPKTEAPVVAKVEAPPAAPSLRGEGRDRHRESNREGNREGRGGREGREGGRKDSGNFHGPGGHSHGRIDKHTPIREVVREGQEVLVQITKEPIGTKGARVSSHVSLPGRYVVYLPTVEYVGVSKRIGSEKERQRLREAIDSMRPPSGGLIVRTVAEGLTKKQLKQDVGYLVRLWGEIAKKKEGAKGASLLYKELDLVLKVARDMFTDDIEQIVIDDRNQYERLVRFVEMFMPERVKDILFYQGDEPIFDAYGIEEEISRSLSRKVPLPSGGYLIIDEAEALTAIDVNTGRFVGKGSKDHEDTIVKTNMEAVHEIAYQLRFRNLGGLIVLDLIDMERASSREAVRRRLEDLLQKDKAKTSLNRISDLGLIEMTRKRTSESLGRVLHEPCFYCDGTGQISSKTTVVYEILRSIRRDRANLPGYTVIVNAHPEVVSLMKGEERLAVQECEKRFQRRIDLMPRKEYHLEQYDLLGR